MSAFLGKVSYGQGHKVNYGRS